MSYRILNNLTHEQWLEERKKGIGGSEAGAVMGVSKYDTPLQLYRKKLGLDPPEPENEAMRLGHELEPKVVEAFARVTGNIIDQSTVGDWIAVSDEAECLRVSPDRMYWPEGTPTEQQTPENWEYFEAKTTRNKVDPKNPPLSWLCQVHYVMGVCGLKRGALGWMNTVTGDFDFIYVEKNSAFWQTLKGSLLEFWQGLQNRIPPAAIKAVDELLLNPKSEKGKTLVANSDDIKLHDRWKEIDEEVKNLLAEKENLEAKLKARLQNAEALTVNGANGLPQNIVTWKTGKKTVFDEEKLKSELPEVFRKYVTIFDKKSFENEDKTTFKKYVHTEEGARRFTVI